MQKKIYISGKITGLSIVQAESLFNNAETQLKAMYPGCEIVNPMKINHDHDKSWENYMRADLKEMLNCDSIYMLNNWQQSQGAIVEYTLAKGLNFKIIHQAK